jgi:hypothetical protein
MKYTNQQLKKWANGDLIILPNSEKYDEQRDDILMAMMPDIDLKENEDLVSDLTTFDHWSDLSAIISDLAEMLIEEREERDKVLRDARRDLQDSIRSLDALINGKSE